MRKLRLGFRTWFGHACAVLKDSSVTCWGQNLFGSFGGAYLTSVSALELISRLDEPLLRN